MAKIVCLAACTCLLLLVQCWGQGLDYDRQATLGATNAQSRLAAVYRNARAWRASYRNAVSVCSRSQGSLCAASGLSTDQKAQLLMATSPQAFDARSSSQMGGFSAVGQVKDQGDCNTCVSFTVLAAAQSAVACALKHDATSSLSEQDFFFCKSVSSQEERTCSSSWSMENGIKAWIDLDQQGKYPTTEYCMQYNPDNTNCDYNCQNTDSELQKGHFVYLRMQNVWEVQEHIRMWGSVVTRLDIYSDFKEFFKKNPGGVYPGPGPNAQLVESHAIQLVGYNMEDERGYWIAKNSWGTGFAAGGFFKVAFGKVGVCSPGDTFGLKFILKTPPGKPYNRLTSSSSRQGCYNYKAQPSDYISKIASLFGMSVQQVLYDNKDVVREPDMFLGGMNIVLCGIAVPGGNGAAPETQQTKPAALPATKQAAEQQKTQTQQQKPQQQKPEQQQDDPKTASGGDGAYVGPLYYLIIGTYKGSISCDDSQGSATAVLQRDDARNVGQVRMETTYVLEGRCTYRVVLACNSVRDGTGTWCTNNEEPWSCSVEQVPQWDACGGEKPSSLQLCYNLNSLLLKSQSPTCSSFSGTLKLQ